MSNNIEVPSIEVPSRELKTFIPTYETKSVYPTENPSATIYFHGLLGLCFNSSGRCEVGVNTQTPSHTLEVEIWKKVPNPDSTLPPSCEAVDIGLKADFQQVNINVYNPVDPGVYVYDGPTPRGTSRYSYVEYCLDLERFYDDSLAKIPGALSPRFYINNGLFSAYRVSKSNFALYNEDRTITHTLGNVALVLAADIFLKPDGYIEFVVDGEPPLKQSLTYGDEYEIAITNSCTSAIGCHYHPESEDPTERNDFYLYYDTVNLRPKEVQFELVNIKSAGSATPSGFGHCCMQRYPFSDPAPCLPIGFGRSSNLP